MGQVLIRDLDDAVIASYRARAKAKGHALETELREVLTEHLKRDRAALIAEIQRLHATQPKLPADFPSVVDLIREDRDTR
jgi:antitoxin FitA